MINQSRIRNRIFKEMQVPQKEKLIQQLIKLNIWDEDKIRKRWGEIEKEKLQNQKEFRKNLKKQKKEVTE